MIQVTHHTPRPALAPFIHALVVSTSLADGRGYGKARVQNFLPRHTPFLCLFTGDALRIKRKNTGFTVCADAVLAGPQTTRLTLALGPNHQSIFIAFEPCVLYRMLHRSMQTFVNRDYDAREFWGNEVDRLLLRLRDADSAWEKSEIVQDFLAEKLGCISPELPFDKAIRHLGKADGNISVARLAELSGLSTRQFERLSNQRLGLTPKLYARLVRFSAALRLHARQSRLTWTEISHACGYFDQMHLIHEFRKLAGCNPRMLDVVNSDSHEVFTDAHYGGNL